MDESDYYHPKKLPDCLDETNYNYLLQYRRKMILSGKKSETVRANLERIYPFLKYMEFQDIKTANKQNLEDYYLSILNNKSESTVYGEVGSLKRFLDYLIPGNDFFQDIKPRKPDVPPKDPITWEDIKQVLKVINNVRDRTMLKLFWETGARRSEIRNIKIKDVKIHQAYAEVYMTGKTGTRVVEIINTIPDLQEWLKQHKFRDDENAALFNATRLRGDKTEQINQPLAPETISLKFREWKIRSKMKKVFTPKAVRAGSATYYSQIFTPKELEARNGWVPGSSVPNKYYIQFQQKDMRNKLMINAGMEIPETKKADDFRPRVCPRCDEINSHDALYCSRCSLILDPKLAMNKRIIEHDTQAVLAKLMSDSEFMESLGKKIFETKSPNPID